MMRGVSAVAAGLGVMLASSLAAAQPVGPNEFGRQGQFIFSADRLIPFFDFTSNKIDNPNPPPNAQSDTITTNQTSISFFWGNNGSLIPTANDAGTSSFFSVPRLGFDYAIIDHLTIGGSIALFFTLGGSTNEHVQVNNVTQDTSTDNPAVLVFGFAPRVGYVLNLTPEFALWLRGGLAYYRGQSKTTDTTQNPNVITTNSVDTFAVDIDPQVVWAPVPHFAFTAGPALDIGFGGHLTTDVQRGGSDTSTSVGYFPINFGITLGVLGWFGG